MPGRRFGYIRKGKYRDRKTHEWKESPYYSVTWTQNGKDKTVSTKSPHIQDAREFLKRKHAEVLLKIQTWKDKNKDVTIAKLWELMEADYLKKKQKSRDRLRFRQVYLNEFFEKKGITLAEELTDEILEEYIVERQRTGRTQVSGVFGASNSTVMGEVKAIVRAFNIARKKKLITFVPSYEKLREANPIEKYWTDVQWLMFEPELRKLDADVADLATFYYIMGWRRNEVLGLRWDRHVNRFSGCILVEGSELKNKKSYEISYAKFPPLKELIERRRQITDDIERKTGKPCPWVFHRARFPGRPVVAFRDIWTRALKAAGLPHNGRRERLGCHDFVRTAVGNWAEIMDDKTIAMMMNKSIHIVRRYLIVDRKRRDKAMEAYAELHAKKREEALAQLEKAKEEARAQARPRLAKGKAS